MDKVKKILSGMRRSLNPEGLSFFQAFAANSFGGLSTFLSKSIVLSCRSFNSLGISIDFIWVKIKKNERIINEFEAFLGSNKISFDSLIQILIFVKPKTLKLWNETLNNTVTDVLFGICSRNFNFKKGQICSQNL